MTACAKQLPCLLAYCVPYAFLAMYGDAALGTVLFYGVMLLCLLLLSCSCEKHGAFGVLTAGNLCSFFSSLFCMLRFQTETWAWYFKPFTPFGLLFAISLVSLLLQLAAVISHRKKRRERQ